MYEDGSHNSTFLIFPTFLLSLLRRIEGLRLPEAKGHAVALADGLVLRAVLIAEP